MWGAKELDREETNFFNTTFKGDIVWDGDFTKKFHEVDNQNFALETCRKLKEETKYVFINTEKVKWCGKPEEEVDNTITCWAMDFKIFVTSNPLRKVISAPGDPVKTEIVPGSNVFPIADKLIFYKQLVKWITSTEEGTSQFGSSFGVKFSSLIKNPKFESKYQ